MAINTEKRIKELEDELRALKAVYNISGGAMKTYISTSQTFTVQSTSFNARVKFTPEYKPEGNLLISSIRCYDYRLGNNFLTQYVITQIQDGSGSVIIQFPVITNSFSVSLASISPGTFTLVE